jgi:hypothetical protein
MSLTANLKHSCLLLSTPSRNAAAKVWRQEGLGRPSQPPARAGHLAIQTERVRARHRRSSAEVLAAHNGILSLCSSTRLLLLFSTYADVSRFSRPALEDVIKSP